MEFWQRHQRHELFQKLCWRKKQKFTAISPGSFELQFDVTVWQLLRVMERATELTRQHLDAIPVDCSLTGLEEFLNSLCAVLGDGSGFEANLLIAWHEARNPELQRLSHTRNMIVQDAIAKRIPKCIPISSCEAANLLHSIISGAAMQWMVSGEGRLDLYTQKRVRLAVSHMFKNCD